MKDRLGHPLRLRQLITGAIALALCAAAIVFSSPNTNHASASASVVESNAKSQPVVNLDGHWHQTKSGIPGAVMDAVVESNKITINVTMKSNDPSRTDVSGLYWVGTFNTGGSNISPFSVTSIGDTGAMSEAMFGSQDSSKVFYYNDGVLSFPYGLMGVSTQVELSRS